MNEREYYRAVKQVEQECDDKLKALDVTWEVLNKKPPPKRLKPAVKRPVGDEQPGAVTKALEKILAELPDEFTTLDIDKIYRANQNGSAVSRSSVTHTLKRMADNGAPLLQIVQPGKGKRPTKYRKTARAKTLTEAG